MINTKKINIALLTEIPKIVITGLEAKKDKKIKKAFFLPINIKNTDLLNNKIVCQNDKEIGIIRMEKEKQYIEIFEDISEELKLDLTQNIVVCNLKQNTICKGDLIYSNNLVQEIKENALKYKENVFKNTVNDINFTTFDCESDLISEVSKQEFDINILIYTCDESEISSDSNLKTGDGCGIVVQDNGYLMPLNLQERIQESINKNTGDFLNLNTASSEVMSLKYQTCFIKHSSVLEKISISGSSPAIGIVIPVKYTDTELAECNVNDIKNAVNTAYFIADKITVK